MKRHSKLFKAVILALVFVLSVLPLTSCGEGVTKAKDTIQGFLTALENNDTASALTFLHPSYEITEDKLIASISEIEEEYSIHFKDGCTIICFREPNVNYSINFPNGLIGLISIKLDVLISGNFITLYVEVLEADGAVGIKTLHASKGDENDSEDGNFDNNSSDTTNSI